MKSHKRTYQLLLLIATTIAQGIPNGSTASAQTAVEAWVQRYHGPTNSTDVATAAVTDTAGNVFVTGYSANNDTNNDYLTIKYSSAGVALWTNRYNGPGFRDDYPRALALDPSGNVFVTGYSRGATSGDDYATIAYSAAGALLWVNRYNGANNSTDQASAVTVDTNGDVIVTGNSYNGFNYDYATIKYSNAGVPLWTNRYDGPTHYNDYATAVAVDVGGKVFVTGYSGNNSINFFNFATLAYSGTGGPLWTNRYVGPASGNDRPTGMAVDTNGNVFVTGYSHGSSFYYDYLTIKYSNAGAPLWVKRYNGSVNADANANGLALDGSGNVFVTGYIYSASTAYDYATIKYSNAGAELWTNRYDGPNSTYDTARTVAVDGGGNAIVTGSSENDYLTVAYSGAGAGLWTNRYNGPASGYDSPYGIAVSPDGSVYVTGSSQGVGTSYDFVTVKYMVAAIVPPVILGQGVGGLGFVGNQFGFNISGPSGASVAIQASTDLQSWLTLATNVLVGGASFYTDLQTSNAKAMFYRAHLLP